MFSCVISDILERYFQSFFNFEFRFKYVSLFLRFAGCETVIMGDVTYGACCVDDFTAAALDCQLLIHYGHSCLGNISHFIFCFDLPFFFFLFCSVPIDTCEVPVMYVFVDIKIDLDHFVEIVKHNFKPADKLILVSTIQFATSLHVREIGECKIKFFIKKIIIGCKSFIGTSFSKYINSTIQTTFSRRNFRLYLSTC